MDTRDFTCLICVPSADESAMRRRLAAALPDLDWQEGDSAWDKIRVWGESRGGTGGLLIRVFRRDSPGPFELLIRLKPSADPDIEATCLALRQTVLAALDARLWRKLAPQPVVLIMTPDGFPPAYAFESDLSMGEIADKLCCNELWSWDQWCEPDRQSIFLEAAVSFRRGGQIRHGPREKIRISGTKPDYVIEIGHWEGETGWLPTLAEVHETIQTTLLPAIGAGRVRAA